MASVCVGGSTNIESPLERYGSSSPSCWRNVRLTWSGLNWKAMMFVGTGAGVSKTTSAPLSTRGLPGKALAIALRTSCRFLRAAGRHELGLPARAALGVVEEGEARRRALLEHRGGVRPRHQRVGEVLLRARQLVGAHRLLAVLGRVPVLGRDLGRGGRRLAVLDRLRDALGLDVVELAARPADGVLEVGEVAAGRLDAVAELVGDRTALALVG